MDVEKQINYWRSSGEEDLEVARSLVEKRHFRHALFFAHLAIEKLLKAHVTRKTGQVPPKIHHLARLAEIAGLPMEVETKDSLRAFSVYQLEGRYPDSVQVPLDSATARVKLSWATEMVEWLKNRL